MKVVFLVLVLVAVCYGRALEEKKEDLKLKNEMKTKTEPLATRSVLLASDAATFDLNNHKLNHPDCTKLFPHTHEAVTIVKEIREAEKTAPKPLLNEKTETSVTSKITHELRELLNQTKEIAKNKTEAAPKPEKDAEKAISKDEKAKLPTEGKVARDTTMANKSESAKPLAESGEKMKTKEEPLTTTTAKPLLPSSEAPKTSTKTRRSPAEIDMSKTKPLKSEEMKKDEKVDTSKSTKTKRSAYSSSSNRGFFEEDDDDFEIRSDFNYAPSFAAVRSSSPYGSEIREAPLAVRSGYGRSLDNEDKDTREGKSYGGGFVRDLPSEFESSFAHEGPEIAVRSSGYGGSSFIREAPEFESRSVYKRSVDNEDKDTREGKSYGGGFVRDFPESHLSDFEAPQIAVRSSGYSGESFIREAPEFESRSVYKRSVDNEDKDTREGKSYGGGFVRNFPESHLSDFEAPQIAVRSSGYSGESFIREAPEFESRSAYKRSVDNEDKDTREGKSYGGGFVRDFPESHLSDFEVPEIAVRSSGYSGSSFIREAPEFESRSGYGRSLDNEDKDTREGKSYGGGFVRDLPSDFESSFVHESPEIAVRSSGYGGSSFIREAPEFESRSVYKRSVDNEDKDTREGKSYGGGFVRDFPESHLSDFEAPEIAVRSSGYGGSSFIREAPEFESRSGYGRSLDNEDKDTREGKSYGGGFVRDFPESHLSDFEAPEIAIRSSGYSGSSFVREAPEFESRSVYKRSVDNEDKDTREGKSYGGGFVRDFPESHLSGFEVPEIAVRSSGYSGSSFVREAPEFESRSGYGRSLDNEDKNTRQKRSFGKHLGYGGGGFRAAQYAPAPVQRVEVIREVPVVKEVEVIREVPVVKEVEVIKEVPVIQEVKLSEKFQS